MLIPYLVTIILSIILSFVGSKRRIGFVYSLLLGLTLSPLISILVILSSPSLKSYKAYTDNSTSNKNLAIGSLVMGLLCLFSGIYTYWQYADIPSEYYHASYWPTIIAGIGFLILAHYLNFLPTYKKPVNFEEIRKSQMAKKVLANDNKIALQNKVKQRVYNIIHIKVHKKKIRYILLVVLFILILTNPGQKKFKEFTGSSTYAGLKREQNWIILSIYDRHGHKYLGMLFNFFKIN